MKHLFCTFLIILLFSNAFFSQRGKNGDVTISSSSIVNEYTSLSSNATIGSTSLNVASSTLNANNRFPNVLSNGDLILIIQMQGVSIDLSSSDLNWGSITNYNNCGNYEYAEVTSVPNSSTINIRCGLQNNYSSNNKVQVIRVPRYDNLIVNNEITAPSWNGTLGGIVAIEANSDITLIGSINVNFLGFRGGISSVQNSVWGGWNINTNTAIEGAEKGESIFGGNTEYMNVNGVYARGAVANGGGGGNGHNAGGGGGANGGDPNNWMNGVGVPNPAYNTAWSLETPNISGMSTSGGGKGGYSFSGNAANPQTTPPNNSAWGSDLRRNVGGSGGHALDYSSNKLFMAGGGGAGDRNDTYNTGGSGGNGGGIVLINCYGQMSGSGSITANGGNGINTSSTSPPFGSFAGNDGSGGGGAGGSILLEVANSLSGITCAANGGKGGDQIMVKHGFFFNSINEAEGPGGGGSGGFIKHSAGAITTSVNGGINGVTNSDAMSSFPPNGATSGGIGSVENITIPSFTLEGVNDTICAGNSASVSVIINGTLPGGTNLIWYDSNGNFIGAGSSFSTTNISTDTTFYVGPCPGTYTIPVQVVMGSSFSFSDANILVSDENCGQNDGSITGITISGGALPLQYEWNAILTTNQDLFNETAGVYTLVVTDNNGCASTIGTYTIGENTGPSIDDVNLIVSDDHCNQGIGAINGITASGIAPLTYEWNGINNTSLDLLNLSSGNFDLTVEDNFGCISTLNTITVNNVDGPTIDSSAIIVTDASCELDNGSITDLAIINPSGGTLTITWSNSENTLDILNLSAGNYSLFIEDNFGCQDSMGPVVINSIGNPSANFSINSNPSQINDSVIFTNMSSNDVTSFFFTTSTGTIFTNQNAFELYSSVGTFEVCLNVTNSAGCTDSTCQLIDVIEQIDTTVIVPNVFTPNNDGNNDLFQTTGLDGYSLSIYNRWGQEIFSASPYLNNWDGRNNSGKEISSGTYFYILYPPSDDSKNEIMNGYLLLSR